MVRDAVSFFTNCPFTLRSFMHCSNLQWKTSTFDNSEVRHRRDIDANTNESSTTELTRISRTTSGCDGVPSSRVSLDQSSETSLAVIDSLERERRDRAVLR